MALVVFKYGAELLDNIYCLGFGDDILKCGREWNNITVTLFGKQISPKQYLNLYSTWNIIFELVK